VVQIWPGQTVTCLHTNSPGHIWTTLYILRLKDRLSPHTLRRVSSFLVLRPLQRCTGSSRSACFGERPD
jgi:hypothetical protein